MHLIQVNGQTFFTAQPSAEWKLRQSLCVNQVSLYQSRFALFVFGCPRHRGLLRKNLGEWQRLW